jgi:hypothetical protein
MRNAINLQIQRPDRHGSIVEVTPLLIDDGKELTSTGVYEQYEGYQEQDSDLYDAEPLRNNT